MLPRARMRLTGSGLGIALTACIVAGDVICPSWQGVRTIREVLEEIRNEDRKHDNIEEVTLRLGL